MEDEDILLNASNENNKDLKAKITELSNDIKNKELTILEMNMIHKKLIHRIDSLTKEADLMMDKKGSFFVFNKNLLDFAIERLNELLECPILLIPMESPVITPSGVTVEKKAMEQLIKSKEVDPFDRNKECKHLISNHFASKLQEIVNDILTKTIKDKKEFFELYDNYRRQINVSENYCQTDYKINVDQELQTDFEDSKINDEDISKNKNSNDLNNSAELKSKLEEALAELQSLKDENDLLIATINNEKSDEDEDKLTEVQNEYESKINLLRKEHTNCVTELNTKISEKDSEIKSYLAKIYQLQTEIVSLKDLAQSSQNENTNTSTGISGNLRMMIRCWLYVCMKLSKIIYQMI